MNLSILNTHSLNYNTWVREEDLTQVRERSAIEDHLCVFGFYFFHWFSFYLWGSCRVFSFMVSARKISCVYYLLWLIVVHVILSIKILRSYCLNDKNLTHWAWEGSESCHQDFVTYHKYLNRFSRWKVYIFIFNNNQ